MSASRKGSRASIIEQQREQQKFYAQEAKRAQENLQRVAAQLRRKKETFSWGVMIRNGNIVRRYNRRDFGLIKLESGHISYKEKRRLYSRYRDIAVKRLKRLKEAGFEQSETYRDNYLKFKKLADVGTEHELNILLREITKFIDAPTSSVTYQKARKESNVASTMLLRYNTLLIEGKTGYPDVTDEFTYWEFYKFWGEIQRRLVNNDYPSEAVAVLYSEMVKRKIPFEQLFPDYAGNVQERNADNRLRWLLGNEDMDYDMLKKGISKRMRALETKGYLKRSLSSQQSRTVREMIHNADYD